MKLGPSLRRNASLYARGPCLLSFLPPFFSLFPIWLGCQFDLVAPWSKAISHSGNSNPRIAHAAGLDETQSGDDGSHEWQIFAISTWRRLETVPGRIYNDLAISIIVSTFCLVPPVEIEPAWLCCCDIDGAIYLCLAAVVGVTLIFIAGGGDWSNILLYFGWRSR